MITKNIISSFCPARLFSNFLQTKELAQDCQIKNVRAPRMEEIVFKSLKQLLNDPKRIEKWVAIYRSKVNQDLPEVQSRQKNRINIIHLDDLP